MEGGRTRIARRRVRFADEIMTIRDSFQPREIAATGAGAAKACFPTVFLLAALAGSLLLWTGAAIRAEIPLPPAVNATSPARHWAFQPIGRPKPPVVQKNDWPANPIDNFVLARLESAGATPAPEADKVTLIRRATFDATGLPPTPQEVRAFLADSSPDAYEKLVDRLLTSPHYGERWGRHWLDAARYVQSRITFPGVRNTIGDQGYRDYVVRAFNNDNPYNRFITEQIAGDLLPASADRQREFDQIVAPAFLSIGAWFDMCTDPNRLRMEMIDDMINVTGRSVLGLTLGCARCHDHKFDPVSTADYYALAGVFGSTQILGDFNQYWRDGRQRLLRPLAMPEEVAANDTILKHIGQLKGRRWKLLSDDFAARSTQWHADETMYRAAADKLPKPWIKRFPADDFNGQHNLRIAQLALEGQSVDILETLAPTDQWVKYIVEAPADGTYRLEALHGEDEPTPVEVTINGTVVAPSALNFATGGWDLTYQKWSEVCTCDLREGYNFIRLETKQGYFPRLDRFRLYKVDPTLEPRIKALAAEKGLDAQVLGDFIKDPEQPWQRVSGAVDYLGTAAQEQIASIDSQIAQLKATVKPYPTVITVKDMAKPADSPIHLKGDVYAVSPNKVPRGPIGIFDALIPRQAVSPQSSGRLELAHWMTDPRNPLPARVMVNRLWAWHFGKGIVATPSDFGTRGALPTHPELLDYLANQFIDGGWSIRQINRLIMTSRTYRMSSQPVGTSESTDPDNNLLSHFNRNRLDSECLYDAMVSTTNLIVRQESGKPLDVDKAKNRALYVLTSGRSPKGLGPEVRKMFELFDYDASGAPISARPQSTTPAQSLFWLNSPLVKYFAGRFADRLLKMDKLDDHKRIEMAYLLALGRSPDATEWSDATEYLAQCLNAPRADRLAAWSSLCQAIYGTIEFRYVE
jgi:hypothetical protein